MGSTKNSVLKITFYTVSHFLTYVLFSYCCQLNNYVILVEFKSIIAFRQHHQIPRAFNQSDLYFLCRMKPITYDITPCPDEVFKCQWIKLDALSQANDVTPLVHVIVNLLRFGQMKGFESIDNYSHEIPSVYPGLKYKLFYRTNLCDYESHT